MSKTYLTNDTAPTNELRTSIHSDWRIVNGDLFLQKNEVNLAKKIHNRLTCKRGSLYFNPNYGSVLLYLQYRYKSGIDEDLIKEIVSETILSEQSVTRIIDLKLSYVDESFTILLIEAHLLVNDKYDVNLIEKIPVSKY